MRNWFGDPAEKPSGERVVSKVTRVPLACSSLLRTVIVAPSGRTACSSTVAGIVKTKSMGRALRQPTSRTSSTCSQASSPGTSNRTRRVSWCVSAEYSPAVVASRHSSGRVATAAVASSLGTPRSTSSYSSMTASFSTEGVWGKSTVDSNRISPAATHGGAVVVGGWVAGATDSTAIGASPS